MQPFVPQKLPLVEVDWVPLIPGIVKANRALAHYNGIVQVLPNPDVLLSPMTTQEAVLSSKIEGTQATLGEVFEYEAGEAPAAEEKRHDILEILNYRQALRQAEQTLKTRPFHLNLLLRLHEILLDSVRGRDKARGKFRQIQNWIGPQGRPIEQASFVPPAPMYLPDHLDNWEKFYHSVELKSTPDAVAQLAIVHAQFEILHPFLDGNGRLGRILIPLFLYERKLLDRPIFYLSEWLEERRDEYVERLHNLGVREGAWNAWIDFFLHGVEEQADRNSERARQILNLYQTLKEKVIRLTRSQFAVPLLDSMFCRPVFQGRHVFEGRGGPTPATVANLLKDLRRAGIIEQIRPASGRRAAIYSLPKLMDICEGPASSGAGSG